MAAHHHRRCLRFNFVIRHFAGIADTLTHCLASKRLATLTSSISLDEMWRDINGFSTARLDTRKLSNASNNGSISRSIITLFYYAGHLSTAFRYHIEAAYVPSWHEMAIHLFGNSSDAKGDATRYRHAFQHHRARKCHRRRCAIL